MSYLQELFARLATLDTSQEHSLDDSPVNPDDEIELGVLEDDEIKRLYCLLGQMRQDAIKLTREHEASYCDGEHHKKHSDLHDRAIKLMAEADIIKGLMWFSLRWQFPTKKGYDGIGLRQGWRVVSIKDKITFGELLIATLAS